MYEVPDSAFSRWGKKYEVVVPMAIDMVCPQCRNRLTFTPANWDQHEVQGKPKAVRCPRCSELVYFLRLGGSVKGDVRVFVDAERPDRAPLAGLHAVPDSVLSPIVKREYEEALSVFSIGAANATAITCRRVLEGVAKSLLPEDGRKKNLYANIQALAEQHETLSKPLVELSDVLRRGGNRGAHFSEDEITTIEGAAQLIELLEYLLTYLYILPAQVRQFSTEVLESAKTEAESKVEDAVKKSPGELTD